MTTKLPPKKQPQLGTTDLIDPSKREAANRIAKGGLLVGGVAMVAWQKPIINSVILPAHAQTSTTDPVDTIDIVDTDFFATAKSVTDVGLLGYNVLDRIIPLAHAIQSQDENEGIDPSSLQFEAEALSKGNGLYDLRIAAATIKKDKTSKVPDSDFVYGWEGSINGVNNAANFSATGCAAAEQVEITQVSGTTMTIQMSYFTKTLQISLDDGAANLPTFPLSCNI